jgi:hypothetical protein
MFRGRGGRGVFALHNPNLTVFHANDISAFVARTTNNAHIIEACMHQKSCNIALKRLPWAT